MGLEKNLFCHQQVSEANVLGLWGFGFGDLGFSFIMTLGFEVLMLLVFFVFKLKCPRYE